MTNLPVGSAYGYKHKRLATQPAFSAMLRPIHLQHVQPQHPRPRDHPPGERDVAVHPVPQRPLGVGALAKNAAHPVAAPGIVLTLERLRRYDPDGPPTIRQHAGDAVDQHRRRPWQRQQILQNQPKVLAIAGDGLPSYTSISEIRYQY